MNRSQSKGVQQQPSHNNITQYLMPHSLNGERNEFYNEMRTDIIVKLQIVNDSAKETKTNGLCKDCLSFNVDW